MTAELRPGTTLARVADLEKLTRELAQRVAALERQAPAAIWAQRELDETLAGNAAAGYDRDAPVGAARHGAGCQCPYCYDDPEVA